MNKGGRPTEGEKAKLAPLNMRTTPEMRTQIEQAAEQSGRSLTQEVERRLRTSFIFDEVRGGPHIGAFANMVCSAIQMIELRTGHRWMDDFATFTQVRAATEQLLLWNSPGSPQTSAIAKAQREALEAEGAADEAGDALKAFHEAHGVQVLGVLAGWATPHSGNDPRENWGTDTIAEEGRLIEAVTTARRRARDARKAFDLLFEAATSSVATAEAEGVALADAVFADLGPKGA